MRSNSRCTARAKLSMAMASSTAPISPMSVLVAVEGASASLTASAPPPVRAYRLINHWATPSAWTCGRTAPARTASGIRAVSALEASAIARSKPAMSWKRFRTRNTNAGRSQKVSVRKTRSRSTETRVVNAEPSGGASDIA